MAFIGLDVGGGSIKGALIDSDNHIIRTDVIKSGAGCSPEIITGNMAELIDGLSGQGGIDGVGIGIPGAVDDEAGEVIFAPNIGLANYPLRKIIMEKTGFSPRLINDANAAALAESRIGAARDAKSIIVFTIGTGIGAGVVLDGRLLTGWSGMASEPGHMVIVKDGKPCACGRRGCFEAYASARALVEMTRRAIKSHPESLMVKLAQNGKIDGKTAFDACDRGDEAAKAVVDEYLDYLALGIANMINIFSPEVAALSGGIANRGERLKKELKKRLVYQTYAYNLTKKHTRLEICSLGYEAGMIGAALYASDSRL